jgi:hypothetical protein
MLRPGKNGRKQFPLPATLDSRRSILGACFVVRDANGHALGGEALTKDEARRIAAKFAKLLELIRKQS